MLDAIKSAMLEAGEQILNVYNSARIDVVLKADESPVTLADELAHSVLLTALSALGEGAVLSEEGNQYPWAERKKWQQYWLVDPLDGTKEFIKRNGEFTVNVALIRDGEPVFGAIYVPTKRLWYWGEQSKGSFKQVGDSRPLRISPAALPKANEHLRVAGSRSHPSAEFDAFIKHLPNHQLVSLGSSLKLCMVADGSAHLYPRFFPTCEWDTAAGQAILEAAGGVLLKSSDYQPLRYNTKENLINPHFIACAAPHLLEHLNIR